MKNPASRSRRLVRTLVAALAAALVATTGTAYGYVYGVDTSHYQHNPSLDWNKVAASGVKFAFLKATEGTSYTDPYFKADWAATAKAGIYHGAYHFARPSTAPGSAVKQADYFAATIGTQTSRGTLPPVLDLESTGGLGSKALISWTSQFLAELQAKTGRDPIIYVSPYFWIDHLANSTAFHGYPLWVAHYGVSQPKVPGGWPTWSFWQSTSSGRIQGISGNVDKDVFNGSMAQLQRFALAYTAAGTRTALSVDNAAPTLGQTVQLSGTLTDSSGKALAGQQVSLQSLAQGTTSWTTLATIKTGTAGAFKKAVTVTGPASYRAQFTATGSYKASTSPTVPVTLTPLDSSLTLSTPTPSTNAGSQLSLAGTLTAGTALDSRNVTIFRRSSGQSSWTRIGTAVTDSAGSYVLDTTAMQTATYRARYSGETAYRSATANVGPVAVTKNPVQLTFDPSGRAPYKGHSVSMRGQLVTGTAAGASRKVQIQQQLPGSSTWHTVAQPVTDSTGHYAWSTTIQQPASYRAVFAGNSLYVAATTAPVAIKVTPPRRTVTELTAGRTELRAGHSVLLHGKLTAAGKGIARTVRLWERLPRHTDWHFVYRTVTVLPDGTCRISASPTRTTIYRLVFHGGNVYAPSQRNLKITVR